MIVRTDPSKNDKRWRTKSKVWAVRYAGGRCQVCGYDKFLGNLVFHHVKDKLHDISRMIATHQSWEKVMEEVDKCVLLCANCHGEVHGGMTECPTINVEEREKNLSELISERPTPKKYAMKPCKECGKPICGAVSFCSKVCLAKNYLTVDWPKDLADLVAASSMRSVARRLGVSDKAVAKRLAKRSTD